MEFRRMTPPKTATMVGIILMKVVWRKRDWLCIFAKMQMCSCLVWKQKRYAIYRCSRHRSNIDNTSFASVLRA